VVGNEGGGKGAGGDSCGVTDKLVAASGWDQVGIGRHR